MQFNDETNTIAVHGREALALPYARWTNTTPSEQVDISDAVMYIEIPGANIRKLLITDSADPKGLLIVLTRTEVGTLPIVPSPFVLIDETNSTQPFVDMEGKIFRTGYKEQPAA